MMRRLIFCAAVALLAPKLAFATPITPTSSYAVDYRPAIQLFGNSNGEAYTTMIHKGYNVSSHSQASLSTVANPTVQQYYTEMLTGVGVYFVSSHGSNDSFVLEMYEHTANGQKARNDSWNALIAQPGFFDTSKIRKVDDASDYYGIEILYTTLAIWFNGHNALVDNQVCGGYKFVFRDHGADALCGPLWTCTVNQGNQNIRNFWEALDGKRGLDYLSVGKAYELASTENYMTGDGSLRLAPTVKSFSLRPNEVVPDYGITVRWRFTTTVQSAFSPENLVSGNNFFSIQNVNWQNDSTLSARIVPGINFGTANVDLLANRITSKGNWDIHLDADGVGETGGLYSVPLMHIDDPAADVEGFCVHDGVATWHVDSEYGTQSYLIEGSTDPDGPWSVLNEGVANGCGQRTVPVDEAKFYKLVEIEQNGRRINHGIAEQGELPMRERESTTPADVLRGRLERPAVIPVATNANLHAAFYTVPTFVADVETYVAGMWRSRGNIVDVVSVPEGSAQSKREFIKNDIVQRASGGTNYFCLIGDANDAEEFDGPLTSEYWVNGWEGIRQSYLSSGYPPGGQPALNLLPTWVIPDTTQRTQNMAYVTPYQFSDLPYANIDNDALGIPDVVITRWPINTVDELLAMAYKMSNYNQTYSGIYPYSASFFVGDLTYDTPGDGTLARNIADAVEGSLPAGEYVSRLYQSEVPSDGARNVAAVEHWNSHRPEVLFIISSASNRSWPGNFFDQTVNPPFTVSQLTTECTPIVVAASCDAGDWARTENPTLYGEPICERMLTAPDRGAAAWIGPSVGTWQPGNEEVAKTIARKVLESPERPMAMSFLLALQEVMSVPNQSPHVLATARTYEFLGDPLSPLMHIGIVTAVQDDRKPVSLRLFQNVPNPFRPSTVIRYDLPAAENVDLRIYSVDGRLVKTLVNGFAPMGKNEVVWHGDADNGRAAPSGKYFYRLKTNRRILTRRMILLK